MNIDVKESIFSKRQVATLLVATAVVITFVGLASDLYSTLNYPGSDLRNRVVGARLMLDGIDPYLFKWQPGLSERLYDPLDDPTELVSKLSVPPTVLTLHAAIAGLSYVHQKLIWLLFQWVALFGTIWIFIRTSQSDKKPLILAIGFCFVNSLFWRFHVSSGQIYIVYAFGLAIAWFFLQQKSKYRHSISGFFAGVAASLRPSFILFFIPFIVRRQYSFLLGGLTGFISSIALSYGVGGGFIWKRYILTILQMTGLVDIATYISPAERALPATDIAYPTVIEGFDWSLAYPLEHYFADTSFYLPLNALHIPNERSLLIFGLLATIVYFSVLAAKPFPKKQEMNYVFLAGVLICLLGDFFIPIPRYPYYDIQMIVPILIVVSQARSAYIVSRKISLILVLGLFLSMIGFLVIPRALFFGGLLIALYVTLISATLLKEVHKRQA